MLDGLLGRGFVPKGKSLIKVTKNRIDVLRRKRNATIKFLKKDLADLLANGLDVNAYGRAGGLLDELRHLWNLDFVEKSCDFVYKHLSVMQKMRECPADCREAVSSLLFAASGFSELPELRDLRHIFHERYGDSLELFVNQELVGNLSSKPFSLEKKVKLMEDVASEFSIQWDSKAFEQRISRHNNASVKDLNKNYGPPHATSDKCKSINENEIGPKRVMHGVSSKEASEGSNNGHSLNRKKADASERRDPILEPAKEISAGRHTEDPDKNHRYGPGGYQDGFSSKERSENVYHGCRSESKDNEVERSEFCFQSRQELSRERHKPHFNNADTFTAKFKHENFFQGNGHQNGLEHEPKKAEDMPSTTPKPTSSLKGMEKFDFGFKQENFFQGYRPANSMEHVPQKLEESFSTTPKQSSSCKTTENQDTGSRLRNGWENRENATPVGENPDGLLSGRPEIISMTPQSKSRDKDPFGGDNWGGDFDFVKSTRKLQEQVTDRSKPYLNNALPPPYVKPNGKARKSKVEASSYPEPCSNGDAVHKSSFGHGLEMVREGTSNPDTGRNERVFERANGHDNVENPGHQVDAMENPLPKRRSSRRKHSKSLIRDDIANTEDPGVVKRRSRSRRKEYSRRGLQVLFDDDPDKDEEERIIDKLLMHYSQKPSCYDEIKRKRESKSGRSRHNNVAANEVEPGSDDMSESIPPPARSLSLPSEQTEPSETKKVFARAASFQPDRSSKARHVHPKLPDYDDLAERFAALKGR